jgi:hypothetical protein
MTNLINQIMDTLGYIPKSKALDPKLLDEKQKEIYEIYKSTLRLDRDLTLAKATIKKLEVEIDSLKKENAPAIAPYEYNTPKEDVSNLLKKIKQYRGGMSILAKNAGYTIQHCSNVMNGNYRITENMFSAVVQTIQEIEELKTIKQKKQVNLQNRINLI